MTNVPVRKTGFELLVSSIARGETVKIGDWTISNAQIFRDQEKGSSLHRFSATLKNENYHNGQSFESMIAIKPAEKENLSGMKVDLAVEIHAKLETHFEGLGYSIEPTRNFSRSGWHL